MASPAQSADLRSKVQDALDSARPALLDHLKAACTSGTRPGELALVLLAAIHDGVPATDAVLVRAIARLAKAKPKQTYDIALRLLVLEAFPQFPDRQKIARKDAALLLAHRCDEGTFQYRKRPSTWDLSNTQYGALGLRAAAALGIKIRRDVWRKMLQEIAAQQAPDGGFCYAPRRHGFDTYASMTAAGIAVLAICGQALGDKYTRTNDIDKQIEKAWAWFEKHASVVGSRKERWSFYFHYGLERAAILTDVRKIAGKVDWYSEGAEMLCDAQLPGGGWSSTKDGFPGRRLSKKRGDSVPTSFAILFLRRKFQKKLGPITQRIVRIVNIGPRSKPKDVEECARQLIQRGKDAMPDVIAALRSEIETQRQAAALALDGIVGDRLGFDPKAERKANRGAVRKIELWYLKNR